MYEIKDAVFESFEAPLCELLDMFGYNIAKDTGVHYVSGGFADAQYDGHDDYYIYIIVKWGIQSDVQDEVHIEHYKIAIDKVMEYISTQNKLIFLFETN